MNYKKHNLDEKRDEVLKLLSLGVPATKVATTYGVTYGQLLYWRDQNQPTEKAA